jgi:hypothetical protein
MQISWSRLSRSSPSNGDLIERQEVEAFIKIVELRLGRKHIYKPKYRVNTLIDNAVPTNNLHARRSDAVPTMMILAGSDDWLRRRDLHGKTNRFQRIYDSENSSSQFLTMRVICHALSALDISGKWQIV